MSIDNRKSPRIRVHIRVSYKLGEGIVERFAENLSVGGVFIPSAEALAQRDVVSIEIELPKHGVFRVNAEVMHVTREGAGLQLKSPPKVFATELAVYLKRLERRTTSHAFVDDERWRRPLAEAGYRVLPLPLPHELINVIGDANAVGLLVPDDVAEAYKSALAFLGQDDSLLFAITDALPVEPVLAWLDDKLLTS